MSTEMKKLKYVMFTSGESGLCIMIHVKNIRFITELLRRNTNESYIHLIETT